MAAKDISNEALRHIGRGMSVGPGVGRALQVVSRQEGPAGHGILVLRAVPRRLRRKPADTRSRCPGGET